MSLFGNKFSKGFSVFKSGYRVNVLLVRLVVVALLIFNVWGVVFVLSHDRFYIVNDSYDVVENPFYLTNYPAIPDYISDMEFLPPFFEAGFKSPDFVGDIPVYSFMILFLAGVFNHFKFNKGFPNNEV